MTSHARPSPLPTAGPPGAWFTAHPKVHPASGNLYAFGYNLEKAPYLTFYQMDAEGREVRSLPLGFTRPCMTHDFFITERFAVFLEGSLYMAPEVRLLRWEQGSEVAPVRSDQY